MPNFTMSRSRTGEFLQAIAPGTTATGTVGAASARVALPTGAEVVRVSVVNDSYIAFGDVSITASGTDMFMPKGVEVFKVPSGATYIAYIQHTTGGVISITAAGD